LGLTVVVGAVTFSSSLGHLLDTPELYGVKWDLAVWNGGGEAPVAEPLAPVAARLDGVEAVTTGGQTTDVTMAGEAVELVGYDAHAGSAVPPLIEGRAPRHPGEVALGSATMRELAVDVGDTVQAVGDDEREVALRVVGRAVLPTQGEHLQLGDGGYTTVETVLELDGESPGEAATGALFLDLAPGTDPGSVFDLLRASGCDEEVFCELFELPVEEPTDIVNFGRVQSTPLVLGGVLGLLAIGALSHILVSAVSRRRADLAVLKVLGYTRRDVRTVVAVQASTLAVIAAAVALPVGLAVGSWLWERRAVDLGIAEITRIPWLAIALMVPAALLVANLGAALPALSASRTRPVAVLRTE
jgi:hypothetical protein